MFAVIHLPQFILQAALRHQPELWSSPIALVDPALTTPRVCDLTTTAFQQGVEAGLTPTQALARCREVSIRHRSPAQEAAATDAVLQCAYGFSPNIEHTAPGTITLDLHGLSALMDRRPPIPQGAETIPGGEDGPGSVLQSWANRLRAVLSSLNLTARIGIGPTPSIARLAAYWTSSTEATHVVTDSPTFIASLPIAALDPSTDVASILQKWGIRTVGELLALGQAEVTERLGLEALALFAAASTQATRPLNLIRPAERYEETFDFEHEVETVEPLLFILNRFVLQISQRLELAGFAAELIALHLRLESGEVLERRLRVPQPTRRADILFRMLETHLETLCTESPIVGVALKAEATPPEQKQFSLFEAALRDPHQFQETLARLSALVGADRVGTPVRENSHRPDAFKLVPPDFENAPMVLRQHVAPILQRTPLRWLRPAMKAKVEIPPRPIALRSTKVVELLGPLFSKPLSQDDHDLRAASVLNETADETRLEDRAPETTSATPVAIHCQLAQGQLSVALGPWRASGHWWEPGRWERDEWDVQTRDGHALRLVRSNGEWSVEAIVD